MIAGFKGSLQGTSFWSNAKFFLFSYPIESTKKWCCRIERGFSWFLSRELWQRNVETNCGTTYRRPYSKYFRQRCLEWSVNEWTWSVCLERSDDFWFGWGVDHFKAAFVIFDEKWVLDIVWRWRRGIAPKQSSQQVYLRNSQQKRAPAY